MRHRLLHCAAWLLASALAACGPPDPPIDPEPDDEEWTVVAADLPGALFSVQGTTSDDVWVVGADGGDGPTVMHWDGSSWTHHATPLESGDLYWVHPFDDGTALLGGSNGAILRYDGDLDVMQTPGDRDVWGIFGTSPDDAWAVGGDANGSGQGFVWRFDGETWTAVESEELPATSAWFKAWGRSADDVYFCGAGGALAHFDGTTFHSLESGTTRPLLTIHGTEDAVTAVGGQFSATMVENTGGGFEDVTPAGPPLQTMGVFHRDDDARAVGMQGLSLVRTDAGWTVDESHLTLREDLHGVWIDPDGGVWSVGGRVISPPLVDGTIVYLGTNPPSSP